MTIEPWVSVHQCRFCGSKAVVPVLYPEGGGRGRGERCWDCLWCDMAWEADIDGSEAVWDAERERYLKETTPGVESMAFRGDR